MNYKKIFLISLVFLLMLTFSAGSVFADTLLIAKDQEAVGFDPHTVPALSSIQVYQHIYNGLVEMDEDGNIVPDLATSWKITDDVVYTFKLREGVKFHNGREMTSEDVKYSFERILDPDTASIAESYFDMVKEIRTPDDYTVVFELEKPFADFLTNVAHVWAAVVPREVVEEHGNLKQEASGTGPFMLEEWVPDNYTLLVKNPDYFEEGRPKVDEIKFLIMKDESSRIAALRSGQVHLSSITSEAASVLEGQEGVEIINFPSLNYTYFGFNTEVEPLNDPRVRVALSYAVDRELLADIVYDGNAAVTGPVSPSQKLWAVPVSSYPSYDYNPEKARELLAEAGYPDGFSFKIKTASTYDYMIDTAVAIQNMLKEINVTTEIELVEWGAYVDAWSNMDHESMVGLNGSGQTPDRALHFFFHSEGTANVWGFSSEEFDELVEEARITTDPDQRYELYAEAQKLLVNEYSPNLFLNSPYNFYAIRNDVKGFNPTALTGESVIKNVSLE